MPPIVLMIISLEAEILVVEVTLIDDGRVKEGGVLLDDLVDIGGNHARRLVVL